MDGGLTEGLEAGLRNLDVIVADREVREIVESFSIRLDDGMDAGVRVGGGYSSVRDQSSADVGDNAGKAARNTGPNGGCTHKTQGGENREEPLKNTHSNTPSWEQVCCLGGDWAARQHAPVFET